MKKIIILVVASLFIFGCTLEKEKASDAVLSYLAEYSNLSDAVLKNIDDIIEREELGEMEASDYKEILKRQYRDLEYTIKNESYYEDTATITVELTNYDYYEASNDAKVYLESHPEEFLTNGEYDKTKYLLFKLNKMKNTMNRKTHTIVIKCIKIDGAWQVEQPSDMTLEKIHGIYNYNLE